MPEQCGPTVYSISHGYLIFPHIQWGAGPEWGKATVFRQPGKNPFTARMQQFICCFLASQTSDHFLPEIIDVVFYM
jgi:hypothetical protein